MIINRLTVVAVSLCFFMAFCGTCFANDCSYSNKVSKVLDTYAETKVDRNDVDIEVLRNFNMAIRDQNFSKQDLICLVQYDFDWESNAFLMESITKHPDIEISDLNKDNKCNNSIQMGLCDTNLKNKLALLEKAVNFGAVLCVDYSDCGLNLQEYKRSISFEILNLSQKNMPKKELLTNIEILLDNLLSYKSGK